MTSDVNGLAKKLIQKVHRVENRVAGLENKNDLGFSSIEDNRAVNVYATDGTPTASFGGQYDGTTGAVSLTGPTPPTPTAPEVEGGAGTLAASWDGFYVNGLGVRDEMVVAPLDFAYAEFHAAPEERGPDFDARTTQTLISSTSSARGGSIHTGRAAGRYWVRIVVRSKAGKPSEAGPATLVTVEPALDPAMAKKLESGLEETRDALTEAAGELGRQKDFLSNDLPKQIEAAAASPITDARLPEGGLSKWPFKPGTIPAEALAPGTVFQTDVADFSLIARKFNTSQHVIY